MALDRSKAIVSLQCIFLVGTYNGDNNFNYFNVI